MIRSRFLQLGGLLKSKQIALISKICYARKKGGVMMETFEDYLATVPEEQVPRFQEIFSWVEEQFPTLKRRVAWNQPMYTDHGTFIIGFSSAKKHLSVAPETAGMEKFKEAFETVGYNPSNKIFRIPWNKPIDWDLLHEVIAFNIQDKAGYDKFWR